MNKYLYNFLIIILCVTGPTAFFSFFLTFIAIMNYIHYKEPRQNSESNKQSNKVPKDVIKAEAINYGITFIISLIISIILIVVINEYGSNNHNN